MDCVLLSDTINNKIICDESYLYERQEECNINNNDNNNVIDDTNNKITMTTPANNNKNKLKEKNKDCFLLQSSHIISADDKIYVLCIGMYM